MSKLSLVFSLAILVLTESIILAPSARAERVLVKSQSGNEGHAWLFGGRGKFLGECWLVVPKHVIEIGKNKKPASFTFVDHTGRGGESGQPIAIENIKGGLSETLGQADLAFAPVKIGRSKGDCKSWLGLPKFTYQTAMRSAPKLFLESMLSTSYGLFDARILRASIDQGAGGLISFRPLRNKDTIAFLKQGLSGSVAEINYQGELFPFGMVIEVEKKKQLGFALRFDLIRNAFTRLEKMLARKKRVNSNRIKSRNFSVISFEAESVSANMGPSSLYNPSSCWLIKPRTGKKSMSITIAAGKLTNGINGITLLQPERCGLNPARLLIDQRSKIEGQWSRVAVCRLVSVDVGKPACNLDLWGARQLQITIDGYVPVAISSIKVY